MAMDNDRHQMMSSNTQVDSLYKSGFFFFLIFQNCSIKGIWKWKSGLKPEE